MNARSIALALATVSQLAVVTAMADQILQTHSPSLTTFKGSSSTQQQNIRPITINRGVGLDGSARAPAAYAWAFSGNPFGDAMSPVYRIGDVNLASGAYSPTDIDLALPAPGAARVVIGRTFNGRQAASNGAHQTSESQQGINWQQISQPELMYYSDGSDHANDVIDIVYGADRYLEFKRTGSTSDYYQARNGAAGVIKRVQEYDDEIADDVDYYIYYDQAGTRTYFLGSLNTGSSAWQFWKIVDTAGNTSFVGDSASVGVAIGNGGYDSFGRVAVLYDAADRRYTYAYSVSTIGFNYRLTQVKAETKTGGTWASPSGVATVGQVDYDYYTGTTNDKCLAGDLKLVTVTMPLTDSGINRVSKKNYWYYTRAWSNSDGRRGEAHQVKMVIGRTGYDRYDLSIDSDVTNDDPLSATEANLKPYADLYLEYTDTGGSYPYRVSSVYANGECGCGGGANGTYTVSYADNGSFSGSSGYDTDWKNRAVVTQPDGNYCSYYFDEVGQPLSRVVTNADPSGSPTKTWVYGVDRNSAGCITYMHTPSNLSSYTHSTGALAYINNTGLVNYFERVPSGDMTGFIQSSMYQKGFSDGFLVPIPNYLSRMTYAQRDFQVTSGVNVTRPVVATSRRYPVETDTYTTSGSYNETSLTYAWWNSTNTDVLYITLKQVTTTLPAVLTASNGSNSSNTTDRYVRKDGTTAFSRAPDSIWDYSAYTKGQLTKQVRDVKTDGSFPSGDDPNTDWGITESGDGSDRTTTYAYDPQGRMSTTTLPSGRIMENYFSRLKDQRAVMISWPRSVSATTRYGPASYSVTNQAGKSECSGVIAITSSGLTDALTTWIDETDADAITALDKGTLASMRTAICSNTGHQVTEDRAYFLLPGSGAGSSGTNYDATTYTYDGSGRKTKTVIPSGTITKTSFDELGRAYRTFVGTDDSGGGGDNMVKISELEFDSGSAGGNSLVTKRTAFIQDSTTDRRDTTYTYDYRGRALLTTNPQAPHTLVAYDNLARALAAAQYSSTGSITVGTTDPGATGTQSNRVALSKTAYDEMGRVWRTTRYKVTQSDGTDAASIDSLTWYDPAGRVIKVMGESAHAKYRNDRLGRRVQAFALAKDDDSQYQHASASTAIWNTTTSRTSVAGDVVLVEEQTAYESTDSDNVLMQVSIARLSNDLANGTTGELDLNADGGTPNLLTITAVDVKGRVQIACMWYDALDRATDSLRLGTNAIVGDRSTSSGTYARGSHGSAPSRSDTELVTTTAYNDNGTTLSATDPRSLVTRYEYDALFRQTKVIHNYDNGTPGPDDKDQTVVTAYSKGLRASLTADLPSPATDQVTTYIYGTTKGTPSQSKVATGHLLRAVKYPDSGNTGVNVTDIDSDSSDVASYAYNAQSQVVLAKDPAGNIIETDLDTVGRETARKVTTLASGFDGAVKRIATTYLGRGLVDKVTQYDTASSGSVTDEVQTAYDDWGNVSSFTQDVDSAIGGSGRASFAISYTYEKATPTGGRTYLRRTGASYPGGSDLSYTYPSAGNVLNDGAGWVAVEKVGAVTVATYAYDGSSALVSTDLNEPNSWWHPATGSSYDDFDQFGRVTRCDWSVHSAGRNTYDVAVAYDRNSNITTLADAIHKNASVDPNWDAAYTIDGLNRLTLTDEGKLVAGAIATNKHARYEQWTLDQVGNATNTKLDLTGGNSPNYSDAGEYQEDRTLNAVNELTQRDQDTNNTAGYEHSYNPTYDVNGNTTDDNVNYTFKWDAFGRLRFAKTRGGSPVVVEEFTYNGLGYRISWHYDVTRSGGGAPDGTVDSDDPIFYFTYDDRWRMIATFQKTDGDPKERFVYHTAGLAGYGGSSYVDAVVLRDRDANTAWAVSSDGVLEERRYYVQNWRADVSAILTDTGKLVEQMKYSSYGVPIALPAGDKYSSGVWSKTESDAISGEFSSPYSIINDIDFDGSVSANDVIQANSVTGGYQTTGRGKLSSTAVSIRSGYAGYELDPVLQATTYHVRYRVYSAEHGRWLTRDPLGYVQDMNLYEYAGDRPLDMTDPSGAASTACGSSGTDVACGGGGGEPPPSSCEGGAGAGDMQSTGSPGRAAALGPPVSITCPYPPAGGHDWVACDVWARCQLIKKGMSPTDPCWSRALKVARDCCWLHPSWSCNDCLGQMAGEIQRCRGTTGNPSYWQCFSNCVASGSRSCTTSFLLCNAGCLVIEGACQAGCLYLLPPSPAWLECATGCGAVGAACMGACTLASGVCYVGVTVHCAVYCATR